MREALDVQVTSSWREFQAVASVLVAAGALEAGTFRVRCLTYCKCAGISTVEGQTSMEYVSLGRLPVCHLSEKLWLYAGNYPG